MSTSTLLHQAVRLPARTRRGGKERALMVMEVVLAVGAYGGGLMMMLVQPDDYLPPEWLGRTPFRSWVLPGVALTLLVGVLPTLALAGAIRRSGWAGLGHVTVGAVLVGWIAIQVAWVGLVAPSLQLSYLTFGLVLVGVAFLDLRGRLRNVA